jgi:hypothetical protein
MTQLTVVKWYGGSACDAVVETMNHAQMANRTGTIVFMRKLWGESIDFQMNFLRRRVGRSTVSTKSLLIFSNEFK